MQNPPNLSNTSQSGMDSQPSATTSSHDAQDPYQDLGLAALVILAQFHGIAINAADI